jgi:hypothetical protein
MSAAISAESVELWSGSFFSSNGGDSTRRDARRRERADLFCLFHASLQQEHHWLAASTDGLPYTFLSIELEYHFFLFFFQR